MTVPERMRRDLAAARQRGLPFEIAWRWAMQRLSVSNRRYWGPALEATRDEWQAAYNREPAPPGMTALEILAEAEDLTPFTSFGGVGTGGMVPPPLAAGASG